MGQQTNLRSPTLHLRDIQLLGTDCWKQLHRTKPAFQQDTSKCWHSKLFLHVCLEVNRWSTYRPSFGVLQTVTGVCILFTTAIWEHHYSVINSSPVAFTFGSIEDTAISVETLSLYVRHLLVLLVPSKEKPHRCYSSFQLLPIPLTPHYHTGASEWFVTSQVSGFSSFTVPFTWFLYLLNIFKTNTKPTSQAVLEMALRWDPWWDGSTSQCRITIDTVLQRNRSWSSSLWGKKGCWKIR